LWHASGLGRSRSGCARLAGELWNALAVESI